VNTPGNIIAAILLFVGVMMAWEVAVRAFEIPSYILPPPSSVVVALWRGLSSGLYPLHFGYTLFETLAGFTIGVVVGLILGTAIAVSPRVEYFLYPYIVMFQALPKVALAPIIVLWFGLGIGSKIITSALIAFFPLMVNTVVGLRSVDEDRLNLLTSLSASPGQIFWYLRFPSALPFIMAGLDLALIFALIGAIVGEFVGAQAGLGVLIQTMNFNMDVSGQFSVLIVLSAIALVLNRIVMLVRRRILFWDASEKLRQPTEGF
jgi:NitT/TauT family transport system permease protein